MKCFIDPRCKINYASYYIYGLYNLLGNKNVKFDISKFQETIFCNPQSQTQGMAILLEFNGVEKKIYIDYHDNPNIIESIYEWSDIYAKSNLLKSDSEKPKIFAIGPSFGLDIWGWYDLLINYISNFIVSYKTLRISKKQFLLDYLYTKIRRKHITYYEHDNFEIHNNYIFHMSTLWPKSYVKNTNEFRLNFMMEVNNKFDFEGGFYLIKSKDLDYITYSNKFKNFLVDKRISIKEYLDKTKHSLFVFNTPSVEDCHGWKLAEYFAMGKVIISTKLSRCLPNDEEHHLLIVDSIPEMNICINKIKSGCFDLEEISKKNKFYYEKFLAPEAVITLLLNRLFESHINFNEKN